MWWWWRWWWRWRRLASIVCHLAFPSSASDRRLAACFAAWGDDRLLLHHGYKSPSRSQLLHVASAVRLLCLYRCCGCSRCRKGLLLPCYFGRVLALHGLFYGTHHPKFFVELLQILPVAHLVHELLGGRHIVRLRQNVVRLQILHVEEREVVHVEVGAVHLEDVDGVELPLDVTVLGGLRQAHLHLRHVLSSQSESHGQLFPALLRDAHDGVQVLPAGHGAVHVDGFARVEPDLHAGSTNSHESISNGFSYIYKSLHCAFTVKYTQALLLFLLLTMVYYSLFDSFSYNY